MGLVLDCQSANSPRAPAVFWSYMRQIRGHLDTTNLNSCQFSGHPYYRTDNAIEHAELKAESVRNKGRIG